MKRLLSTTIIMLTLAVFPLQAFAFNPNNLVSDWELTNAFSLDFNQIQHFLKRGYLAGYKTEDWQGNTRFAADIIWRAAQQHGISPKFLLVLLQKEQSLVEDDNPTQSQLDWATGYAVCDVCAKSDPSIQRWKGFGKQVNSAALQFTDGYLVDIEREGVTQGKYGPGIPVEIDGTTVVPENAATASLYAYTPHLHGNKNLAAIWDRWFSVQHPTGTLLKAFDEPGVFKIEFGYKRAIKSWSALQTRFNPNLIIEVPKRIIEQYPEGRSISFPNYSLLRDDSGRIYLLVDDALRHIDSMETFRSLGFKEEETVNISNTDLVLFDNGEPITGATTHPQGTLLQLTTTGAVYYIQDGKRHPVTDKAVLDTRFPNRPLTQAKPVEVEQFREANQLLLPDGVLAKGAGGPEVFIISEGERRPIASESVFLSYGYSWDDIITIKDIVLNAHPLGDPVDKVIGEPASN